ncbi:MAG TPA: PaaI family thioesterase [Pyrinomonadaceae bacterium]|nr:PaaI family thioesterase [Pyrinomonadaceae bacterium]
MSQPELTDQQQQRIKRGLERMPFGRLLGIQLESAERGMATMSFEVNDSLKQNNGVLHGGAIASLIDTATAFAIIPLLKDGETASTIELSISYLRPLITGKVTCSALVRREGKRIIALSAEVLDSEGNLAATSLSTYMRLSKRPAIDDK